MHVHNVYFWLKDGPSRSFEEGLSLLFKDPNITSGSFGKPIASDRAVVDDTFTYAMTVTFQDTNAHDSYQDGEIHLEFMRNHADKWEKVAVYDIETL